MPLLMLADLPRYECLLAAAERYPSLEPSAIESFLHLLRTADLVSDDRDGFLARHHLSPGRFTVLMLLNHPGEETITPADLAAKVGVARATITGLIDTLEKDGLVVREADVHDRRTIHLRLTPRGRALVEEVFPPWCESVSRMMQPLTEPERRQLVQLLQKIQASLTPPTPVDGGHSTGQP